MKVTTTLARCQTPDGESMLLQEHDGQYFLKVNGVTLMSTTANHSEQHMGDVACERKPKRVLIGGLGFGFTLRRVLELCGPDAEVVVAELLPEIIEWNREYLREVNGECMDDKRVSIHLGDVNECIEKGAGAGFDAILLDVDNGPDSLVHRANDRFYGRRGLRRMKAALTQRGRVIFWSANRDKAFLRELQREFHSANAIGSKSYAQAKKFTHTLFIADRS